jgi:signal transduction histidine kinase/ligand-binding sensor domain-containing protein/DNA-binding response OmpR family regulator
MKLLSIWGGVLLLILGHSFSLGAQDFSGHHIKKLSQKNGLSSGKVNVILKDSRNFVWLGTDNGIDRFDGKKIKTFCLAELCDSETDVSYIRTIFETSDGQLWVGTKDGLFYFDRNTEQFISFQFPGLDVLNLTEDLDGNLLIGTNSGAYVLLKVSQQIISLQRHLGIEENEFEEIASVSVILADRNGHLWLGSWNQGLYLIDPQKKTQENVSEKLGIIEEEGEIKNISAIIEGPDGSIWIGAYELGLFRIAPNKRDYQLYQHDPSDPNSLNNNRIKSLSFDKRGYLWIGLEEGGLDRFAPADEQFKHFLSSFQGEGLQEGYSVYSTYVDNQDQIWIGFRNDGLLIAPLFSSLFEEITYEEDGLKEAFAILSLFEEENSVWAGIIGGLRKIDKRSHLYQNYMLPGNASPLSVTQLDEAHLLVGTMTGEIFLFNKNNGSFRPFLTEQQQAMFKNSKVNTLYRYSNNKLFIGAKKGTFLYNLADNSLEQVVSSWTHTILTGPDESIWFIHFGREEPVQYFPETGKTIIHSPDVNGDVKAAIYIDDKLYLGTDLGLFKYDVNNKSSIQLKDIFPYINQQVNAMLLDDSKNIWFSSVDGIIRLNTSDDSFRSFDAFDGVPDIRFRDEVAVKLSDGRLAFGGNGGLTILSPEDYLNDDLDLNLEITDILINGSSLPTKMMNGAGLISLKHLKLKSNQRTLSVEFSLLSYTNPGQHRYQYRMAGGGQDWINLDNNKVDLINIPTGSHELHIRAANENGNWTEEKVLSIRVLPPLFLRWYFILLYLIAAGALIYFAFKARSNQLHIEKEFAIEHLKLENIREKVDRETEFHEMRLMFFTNISHEFRTPLTLILAPLEKFMQKGIIPSGEHLKLMYKNAERLRRLIGQILDFRKMEAGELRFEPTFGDIVKFSKECWNLFEPLAQKNGISFEFQSEENSCLLWFDKDKYEKIIINLLSNAFKFTESGSIVLSLLCKEVEEDHTEIEIKISDTGSGISEQDLPHIFDRFYNTKASLSQRQNGTGIGLSLVKELVLMHKGTIDVQSVEEEGTCFVISLHLENINKSSAHPDPRTPEGQIDPYMNLLLETTEESEQHRLNKDDGSILPTILVVEDDSDLRNYINVEFRKFFTIIEAEDGAQGLKQAFKYIPDLVISDVSMPVMDGLEMSEVLKKDERTSHIPIVLLTAHGTFAHQKKGFEIGVEDFITKPFSSDILEIRIHNLLQSRKDLQDKFSKEFKVEPSGLPVSSMDQTFLNRAMEVIEENLNNSQFSAIVFAEEMCMSRVHLYRKLKALTNESVSGFVKVVRLKLAAELIKDKKMRIKEAAYTVGYSDPKYFSKCFKQQFGMNPSEYAEGAVG